MVIVQEGRGWVAFVGTAPQAADIPALAADRSAIEQTCNDLRAAWGAGRQQWRDVYANGGACHRNGRPPAPVGWWAWDEPDDALVERRGSPWDVAARRPSHAGKRRAVPRWSLAQQGSGWAAAGTDVAGIVAWAEARWRRVA